MRLIRQLKYEFGALFDGTDSNRARAPTISPQYAGSYLCTISDVEEVEGVELIVNILVGV